MKPATTRKQLIEMSVPMPCSINMAQIALGISSKGGKKTGRTAKTRISRNQMIAVAAKGISPNNIREGRRCLLLVSPIGSLQHLGIHVITQQVKYFVLHLCKFFFVPHGAATRIRK